ncbi:MULTISPECIES: SAF domain-containing protein [unclassified Microbacterium]|uniref:SAF domain-containing protein n=1 Tax=unclassified Microbacterium TaxID=2609290 RepID=UPI00301A13E7
MITEDRPSQSTEETAGRSTGKAVEVKPVRTRAPASRGVIAAAFIVLGMVVSYFIFVNASNATQVWVAKSAIVRGHTIVQDDLTTLSIAAGQDSTAIPQAKADQILGKVATTDLPAGALVTMSSISDHLQVPNGKALVGMTLGPAKLPAQTLHAGDNVVLVPVPAQGAAPVDVTAVETVPAVVSQIRPVPNTNDVVVDVYVSPQVAPNVASRGAAGSLTLYLAPGDSQ